MMAEFEGRTALVTGGTKGIGRAIVRDLLESGFNVVFTARSKEDVEAVAQGLSASWPGRVLGLAADVRDPEACEEVVAKAVAEFGGLDLLVNNAGVGKIRADPGDVTGRLARSGRHQPHRSVLPVPSRHPSSEGIGGCLDPEHWIAGRAKHLRRGSGL